MDADFPAAHSMDTHWYAVDRDGHVAMFDTGEPGPVPAQALKNASDDYDVMLKKLFFAAPGVLLANGLTDQIHRHLSDAEMVGSAREHMRLNYDRRRHALVARTKLHPHDLRGIGVLLRSQRLGDDLVSSKVEIASEMITPAGPVVPVYFEEMLQADYDLLHDSGECLACVDLGAWFRNPERLGLFVYSAADHYENGPYELDATPAVPLTIGELPSQVTDFVNPIRFESLQFGEARFIQPLELTPCAFWGDYDRLVSMGHSPQYMASDGRTMVPLPREKVVKWK